MSVGLPYHEIVPDLKFVYLEDSYVLGIHEIWEELFFDMIVVLTEEHPLYEKPLPDEQYCYKAARLRFTKKLVVSWIERSLNTRNVDPDGSIDLGNIDRFELVSDGYCLWGDWGDIIINCKAVNLDFR